MKKILLFSIAVLSLTACKDGALNPAEEQFSSNAKSAMAILPKDADVITKVNVNGIRNDAPSLFGQFNQNAPAEFNQLIAATGFDPKKDVKEMYMTVKKVDSNDGDMNVVVFAEFDKDKLSDYIQNQAGSKFTTSTYRNSNVYCSVDGSSSKKMCFSVGGDKTLNMASSESSLKEMIDRANGQGTSIASDTEMMQLLDQTQSADEGWMIMRDAGKMFGNVSSTAPSGGTPQEQQGMMAMNQIAAAITSVVARTDVNDSTTRSLIWMLPKQGVSQNDLKAMFDAGLSAARYMMAQNANTANAPAELAQFRNVIENTKVTTDGKGVLLDASIPMDMIKKK